MLTAIIISKPAQQPSSPLNYTLNIYPNSITAAAVFNDDTTLNSKTNMPTIIKMLQTEKEMYMKRCQDLEMKVHVLETLLHTAKMQTKIQFWSFQERGKKHPLSYERPTDFKENETNTLYIHNEIYEMFKFLNFKPANFHIWSEEPGSFCHKISNLFISWSYTVTKHIYWEKSLLVIINAKFSSLVNNANQKMRE